VAGDRIEAMAFVVVVEAVIGAARKLRRVR
jgi:hypothetical protein